jgi:hypothetical protein
MNDMKEMIEMFVDGSDVDYVLMLTLGLIEQNSGGYALTSFGKSFLRHIPRE